MEAYMIYDKSVSNGCISMVEEILKDHDVIYFQNTDSVRSNYYYKDLTSVRDSIMVGIVVAGPEAFSDDGFVKRLDEIVPILFDGSLSLVTVLDGISRSQVPIGFNWLFDDVCIVVSEDGINEKYGEISLAVLDCVQGMEWIKLGKSGTPKECAGKLCNEITSDCIQITDEAASVQNSVKEFEELLRSSGDLHSIADTGLTIVQQVYRWFDYAEDSVSQGPMDREMNDRIFHYYAAMKGLHGDVRYKDNSSAIIEDLIFTIVAVVLTEWFYTYKNKIIQARTFPNAKLIDSFGMV